MNINLNLLGLVCATLGVSFIVAIITTPIVKQLAQRVGAVDDPKKDKDPGRRIHTRPIPRMGGLAIFLGFLLSVLIFVPLTGQVKGMLLGAVIIVVLGIFDDIYDLRAMFKFGVQIVAALVAVLSGNEIVTLSNPNIFSANPYWDLGWLAIPVSVFWIVAITNAVNLIDGLDGLACGVSSISSMTLLVITLVAPDIVSPSVPIMVAALAGGCLGFLPYNLNPAKIFMGDTGSTFLGYALGVISIQGVFKLHIAISFVVPFLMLGLPIFDTAFAFIRRIAHGQSPMHPDRSHVHHRLMDMGFSQKQTVAILYVISAVLGLSAVVLTTSGPLRAMLVLMALCVAGGVAMRLFIHPHGQPSGETEVENEDEDDEEADQ